LSNQASIGLHTFIGDLTNEGVSV